MESFGKWLSATINAKGWKPADLARQSGLDSAVISNLLNSKRGAGPETCTAIADALGLPPEIVFRAAGLLPPAVDDQWAQEMSHKLEKLDPARRQIAQGLLETLLKEPVANRKARKPRPSAGKS